jgi:hypothetical protein
MAYTSSDAATRLAAVRSAIDGILSGNQEYMIGDRRFRKADLGKLREMESALVKEVSRASRRNPGASRANFGGLF